MGYKKPTSTKYTKFFIEDRDVKPGITAMQVMISKKSNLIMNLDMMGFREKRKAAKEIIQLEIQIAKHAIDSGEVKHAASNLASALNTRKLCRRFEPIIDNDLLKRAWTERDPSILVNAIKKKGKKYIKGKFQYNT